MTNDFKLFDGKAIRNAESSKFLRTPKPKLVTARSRGNKLIVSRVCLSVRAEPYCSNEYVASSASRAPMA